MDYVSTRGCAPVLAFDQVLMTGLARDGGLYVPAAWPRFDRATLAALAGRSYAEIATRVMLPFVTGVINEVDFARMVDDAYRGFDHAAVAPLRQLDGNLWLLELFHGPTLSFKDYALQLVGRLFEHVLTRQGRRITIVGATSGDTGSAAIEACRDRDGVEVFILHPKDRISAVQRRQMTTVASANVTNIAVEGTFDDCQDLVKAMFNDAAFRDRHGLAAVNSINWARIMAQTAYYVVAAVALGAPARRLAFAVPTGNFGNVYAAYAARRMGLAIERLVIGSNVNDILTRFLATGEMALAPVQPTLSPAMDIQVSSNVERLLFDHVGRDGARLERLMERFRRRGRVAIGAGRLRRIAGLFTGHRLDDDQTRAAIRDTYVRTGVLVDPHTAIGIAAGRSRHDLAAVPLVAVATAHPAKFPAAVEQATGVVPALPPRLADLMQRPERLEVVPNRLAAVQALVSARCGRGTVA